VRGEEERSDKGCLGGTGRSRGGEENRKRVRRGEEGCRKRRVQGVRRGGGRGGERRGEKERKRAGRGEEEKKRAGREEEGERRTGRRGKRLRWGRGGNQGGRRGEVNISRVRRVEKEGKKSARVGLDKARKMAVGWADERRNR